jgi:hypothetical protein
MPWSHIHGFDAGLAADTIWHRPWQSVLVCSFPYCVGTHSNSTCISGTIFEHVQNSTTDQTIVAHPY